MDSDTKERIHALALVVKATRDFQTAFGKRKSLPIRQALYDFWETRDYSPKSLKRPDWTAAARKVYRKTGRKGDIIYDHAVPLRLVVDDLLAADLNNPDAIKQVLDEKLHIRLISQDEDARLREAGLRQSMPPEYDDPGSLYYRDPLARYRTVGIDLGEDGEQSEPLDAGTERTGTASMNDSSNEHEDFGFEPGSDRAKLAKFYARECGATHAEILEKYGNVPWRNLLTKAEEWDHKVEKTKELNRRTDRMVTRYRLIHRTRI